MRRLVLVVALLAGCKGMGGLGSGLGHVASGLGHVASGVGHVASAVGHVAAPVANGFAKVATPVLSGAAKVAPVVGRSAVYAMEAVAEASTIEIDPVDPPAESAYDEQPTTDLCLDCPDVGNCSSCPAPVIPDSTARVP